MSRRTAIGLALLGATIGLVGMIAPAAATAASASSASSGSASAARTKLLQRRDLGPGWSVSSAAPAKAPGLACAGSGGPHAVRSSGRAASATFAQSSQGPFAFDISAAFASPAVAARWWSQVVHPPLRHCFAKVLEAGSGHGVKLRATSSELVPLPGAPSGTVRYRVSGQASASGQSSPVYLDVLLVRRGGFVSELQLSSFGAPAPSSLEVRLGRRLVKRLSNP